MSDEVLILIMFDIAAVAALLFAVAKRVVKAALIRSRARLCVSGSLFLPRDKGARLAYKGVRDCFTHNYERALAHFEEAMKYSYDEQNRLFCLEWMTRCHDARERYDRSLDCCVKAAEACSDNAAVLFGLADRYSGAGRFEKAKFYYEAGLRYAEKNDYARFMLGELEMLGGNYEKAAERIYPLAEADGNPVMAARAALLAAIEGEERKSRDYLEAVVKFDREERDRLEERLNCISRVRELCDDS